MEVWLEVCFGCFGAGFEVIVFETGLRQASCMIIFLVTLTVPYSGKTNVTVSLVAEHNVSDLIQKEPNHKFSMHFGSI